MTDLRLIGLSEDGSRLVLEQPSGEKCFLPVDERIHAALRGDRARLGQLQIEVEGKLRPREIQARIRAGQSLEEVASIAGMPADRVLAYAGPILHEREHIAQEAAKAGVKRDDHGAVMLLGELVAERLEDKGVPREGVEWDAWRRDDGGWEVRLDYLADDTERSALWVYDPVRRTVTPDDDDARWLLEEGPTASVTTLRSVSSHSKTGATASGENDADEPANTKVGQPSAPAAPTSAQETLREPATASKTAAKTAATGEPGVKTGSKAEPSRQQPAAMTPREKAIEAAQRGRKHTVPDSSPARKRRAAVPSWDEILFGSRKPE